MDEGARPLSLTTYAAVGAFLAWFLVQLAPFIGEAPDLDAMISLRESLVFHREGFDGLVDERVGTGVHPPALDLLSSLAFTLFGEDPRSQQLIAVVLFVVLAPRGAPRLGYPRGQIAMTEALVGLAALGAGDRRGLRLTLSRGRTGRGS